MTTTNPPSSSTIPESQPAPSRDRHLTLIRTTDTHPPHHAHFDVPEGKVEVEGEDDKGLSATGANVLPVVDIEHVPVDDDPREWSTRKKTIVLYMMTIGVLGPLIAPSIYNPVIDEVKADLHATDTQVGLSISMYILFQGWMPLIWASSAEIIGRKPIYLASYGLYVVACIVASRASTMPVLIAMRCLQATGSAAVVAVGAGSLADIFEVHERGQKLGLFYGMPLLGPAIGPLIGGALGNAFGWRATLYFLAAFAAVIEVMFLFFPDTWRKERSRVYQQAMERAIKRALNHDEKRQRKLARGLDSKAPTPPFTPGAQTPYETDTKVQSIPTTRPEISVSTDTEANKVIVKRRWWQFGFGKGKEITQEEEETFRPTLRDVNPFPTMWSIYTKPTNIIILLSSGILFSGQYTITYTASITLARNPYSYSPIMIGVVILAFGVGSIFGSILGGRWSDRVLRRLKKANGGVSNPEMRLQSTVIGMPLVISAFLAYGWCADKHVHIAGIVVTLFFCGMGLMLIYSSTLAYLVDANPGRSASAVSCNSFMRGTFGCILSQVALPIQNAIGDGGLYTLFAGLLCLSCSGIGLLIWKGQEWRSPEHRFPWRSKKLDQQRQSESDGSINKRASMTGSTAVQSISASEEEDKSLTPIDGVGGVGVQVLDEKQRQKQT
ncbi:major facilitator superfamily domain-containing protein [Naematelia encephala]|uniref:Major facilitator superfamily domain-containing protein n=1 Tax=Naematelia encephala TaxID=71784 RepID=A0A1Y2BDL8_9TREE|nr:major facilitator superfamily domain-containing protein [Naematelia encephala]